jgi:hypothetical protein
VQNNTSQKQKYELITSYPHLSSGKKHPKDAEIKAISILIQSYPQLINKLFAIPGQS